MCYRQGSHFLKTQNPGQNIQVPGAEGQQTKFVTLHVMKKGNLLVLIKQIKKKYVPYRHKYEIIKLIILKTKTVQLLIPF
jgi:hypothetical protein